MKDGNHMKGGIKLTGHIKATVKRADGTEYVHLDEINTIESKLLQLINDALRVSATNFALDNLFDGNTTLEVTENGEDGIALDLGTDDWYEMNCSASEPSATSTKITGTFTGTAATIAGAADVSLGHDWNDAIDFFNDDYASPTSWTSLTIAAADTLTIEWTITVS